MIVVCLESLENTVFMDSSNTLHVIVDCKMIFYHNLLFYLQIYNCLLKYFVIKHSINNIQLVNERFTHQLSVTAYPHLHLLLVSGAFSQLAFGERQGTPSTGPQFITDISTI